jgi:hypothetical protein
MGKEKPNKPGRVVEKEAIVDSYVLQVGRRNEKGTE